MNDLLSGQVEKIEIFPRHHSLLYYYFIFYALGAYVMSFPGGQSSGIQVISPHTPLNYHYSTSATVPTEAFSRNSVKPEEIRCEVFNFLQTI